MSEWETFCDISYYHLWRVRRKNERGFNDGYHLQNGEEAQALVELLNRLERECVEVTKDLEFRRELYKVQEQYLETARRERDEWRKKFELSVDAVEIAARLARAESERDEAIKQIHEEARDYELQIKKLCEAYNDLGEQNAKLRAELDQLKEGAKCPVCTPEQKCWECADDTSLKEGAK